LTLPGLLASLKVLLGIALFAGILPSNFMLVQSLPRQFLNRFLLR
jgi:hypothetical protein